MSDETWAVTWDAARRAQVRAVATTSIEGRLRWLGEALELARTSGALAASCAERDREALRIWNGEG